MRSWLTLTFILLILCLTSFPSFGQGESSIRFQGFMGLSSPAEKNLTTGFWSSFGFSFPLKERIRISFNFGYWKSQVTEKQGWLYDGDLSVNPFFISVQYHLVSDKAVNPYIFLGGGFLFSGYKMENIITLPEITLSQQVDNGPGVQAGVGLQVKISKNLALCAEAAYLYCQTNATTTIQDMNFGTSTEDFKVLLSALIFQLGLKFFI